MKDLSQLNGLERLTQAVLACSIRDSRRARLTDDHMEVLSGIVLHHLDGLPEQERDVLVHTFGLCGKEIKPLKIIGKELGVTEAEIEKVAGEALGHLIAATCMDIFKTMDDIENGRTQA